MAFHPAEINQSHARDAEPPLAGNHLADSSLSSVHAARSAMESEAVPGEFGNLSIDFGHGGGVQAGEEAANKVMAASDPSIVGKIKDPAPGLLPSKPGDVVIVPLDPGGALLIGHDGTIIHVPKK